MRKLLILLCAALLGGMAVPIADEPQLAQLMMMGQSGGPDSGTSFTGPLDSLPATGAAYSLRRLLSAYTANKAVHLTCSGGTSSSGDVGFTATGDFDTTGYNTRVGTGSCKVDTVYDQSGNGLNLTQATGANQPTITLNATNGRAVLTSAGGTVVLSNASITAAQPATVVAVAETTVGATGRVWQSGTGGANILFNTATALKNAAGFSITTVSGTYYSIADVLSGGNDNFFANGTSAGGAGTASLSGVLAVFAQDTIGDAPLTGNIGELLVFGSALSTANRNTVMSNEQTYFGAS